MKVCDIKMKRECDEQMHQSIVYIIVDRVKEQFITEKVFCQEYLDISEEEWADWKKGAAAIPGDKMQKIKGMFSDYEWMLIQKIARQTILFPEKRHYVVSEYKRLKSIIATNWLKTGVAQVELITQQQRIQLPINDTRQDNVMLRIVASYGEWGYDDILEFSMPAMIQQQIAESKVDLLEWVDENLVEAYTEKIERETNNK